MKRTLKLLAMAFMAGAMFTACGGDDDNGKDPQPKPEPEPGVNYPSVTLVNKPSGTIKAGFADAILITGSGFDPDLDYIYVGYDKGGDTEYIRVMGDVLTMNTTRISFGVPITAGYLDKTITVYLDRPDYDRMPISGEITFTMPTAAEGYIPDPAFRATLMSISADEGNPEIAPLFDSYGLLDVAAAGRIEMGNKAKGYALNLYACKAKSLEGIELFKNIQGTVAAWAMDEIEEIDFSSWTASSEGFVAFFINGAAKLKKFIGGPSGYRYDIFDCPNLEYVDLSKAKRAYNIQLYYDTSATGFSSVTYLDMRKDRSGKETGGPNEGEEGTWKGYPHAENEWAPFLAGSWFKVADNCHILVDYQFLLDKYKSESASNPDGGGYGTIYNAWKRGATIDVYSSKDNSKKLGTVPMYASDKGALTPTGDNGWKPSETE